MDLRAFRKKLPTSSHSREVLKQDLAFQLGREIESIRIMRGMTQAQLARKIKTHQPSIARAESGAALPSITFLKKIADALKTTIRIHFEEKITTGVDHSSNPEKTIQHLVKSPIQIDDIKYPHTKAILGFQSENSPSYL